MGEKELLCGDLAGNDCGLKRVLNIIGGKWKILILCVIDKKEVVRYGDLRREIYGITNTMLANSLKEMETDGMIIGYSSALIFSISSVYLLLCVLMDRSDSTYSRNPRLSTHLYSSVSPSWRMTESLSASVVARYE